MTPPIMTAYALSIAFPTIAFMLYIADGKKRRASRRRVAAFVVPLLCLQNLYILPRLSGNFVPDAEICGAVLVAFLVAGLACCFSVAGLLTWERMSAKDTESAEDWRRIRVGAAYGCIGLFWTLIIVGGGLASDSGADLSTLPFWVFPLALVAAASVTFAGLHLLARFGEP